MTRTQHGRSGPPHLGRSVGGAVGLGRPVGHATEAARVAEAGRATEAGRARRLAVWVAAFCAWHACPAAQTARLTVPVDSVSAGEPFEVSVAVTHAPGRQVAFPDVAGDPDAGPLLMLGDAEALSVRRLPPSIRGAVRVDSAVFRVVTFAADSARVGPVRVRVDTSEVATSSALVGVRSVLSGPPPHAPAGFTAADTFPSATPLWVGLGLLAAAVTAGAVWALAGLLRRPRGQTRTAPYPAARARLEALARDTPQTAPQVEAHVVAVRDVVRGYLADRLGVSAREATTSEIAAHLDGRVSAQAAHAVRQSLVPTDLVAFAGVRPGPDVVARLRDQARAAIEAVEAEARESDASPRESGNRPAAPSSPLAP